MCIKLNKTNSSNSYAPVTLTVCLHLSNTHLPLQVDSGRRRHSRSSRGGRGRPPIPCPKSDQQQAAAADTSAGGRGEETAPPAAAASALPQLLMLFVPQVVDIMRVNVDKVLERDQKLSELDDRADALQAGASQFESSAAKLKNKYWWKNCKVSVTASHRASCSRPAWRQDVSMVTDVEVTAPPPLSFLSVTIFIPRHHRLPVIHQAPPPQLPATHLRPSNQSRAGRALR